MFTDVWSAEKKLVLRVVIIFWFISIILFYAWWFIPAHINFMFGFVLTTIVVSWPIVLFSYCLFFVLKMKKPDQRYPMPQGLRVAMVVTKIPTEPLELLQKTLRGALIQNYPHDVWIADEHPSDESLEWYSKNNIHISTRKDDALYHNDSWPRKKKTKEGNLAFFYDNFGYHQYDVVVQMDADHVPGAGYLESMLRPFNDPSIGYVAAPSVCDINEGFSWSARARMHSEAIFHGPIQSGSNNGWVPICIGSHYAVRTKALEEIGGIGPELAEDYSTTLLLNAAGWKGSWVYDAEARGEGPNSFADLITQDYQWARSLTIIFLTLFPKVFRKLSLRQNIQFIFTQLWYPMGGMIWLLSIAIIFGSLIIGQSAVGISFAQFLFFIDIPILIIVLMFVYIRRQGHMRPKQSNFLTWESIMFEFARWPWVIIACFDALYSVLLSKAYSYKVTSKGKASHEKISLVYLIPYLVVVVALMIGLVFQKHPENTFGYGIFATVLGAIYSILAMTVIVLHIREIQTENTKKHIKNHSPHIISSIANIIAFSIVAVILIQQYAVFYQKGILHLDGTIRTNVDYTMDNIVSNKSDVAIVDTTVIPETENLKDIEYVVESGNSLWRIARKHYGHGSYWRKIVETNTTKITDPNYIVAGTVLVIPDVSTQ